MRVSNQNIWQTHSLLTLRTRTLPFDFSFYDRAESPSEQDEIKRIPCSAWLPQRVLKLMDSSFRGRVCRGWGVGGGGVGGEAFGA